MQLSVGVNKIIAFLSLLLSVALDASASGSTCAIKEGSLVGNWEQSSKVADYEVMAFEQEGNERVFESWRHNRPDVSQGMWKVENCQLTIWADPADAKRRAEYLVLDATPAHLRLRDADGRESSYSKIVEPTVRRTLITSSFNIRIRVYCDEGSASCDNVEYVGTSKKTGKSIRLHGRTQHMLCTDRMTPCQFVGYEFQNGQTRYLVSESGNLRVTEGSKVLLEQQGEWH